MPHSGQLTGGRVAMTVKAQSAHFQKVRWHLGQISPSKRVKEEYPQLVHTHIDMVDSIGVGSFNPPSVDRSSFGGLSINSPSAGATINISMATPLPVAGSFPAMQDLTSCSLSCLVRLLLCSLVRSQKDQRRFNRLGGKRFGD